MIVQLSIDQIVKGHASLPSRVRSVLHSSEEVNLAEKLEEIFSEYKISDITKKKYYNFYISVILKANKPELIGEFIGSVPGISRDENFKKALAINYLSGLYLYGDYIPETKTLFQKLGLQLPKEEPLINTISEVIDEDAVKEAHEEAERKRELAKRMVPMPFSEALKKYPQIGEQLLTMNQIKIKLFPTPVRPSVKNWINDYYDNMGAGKHGAVDRGNYLFHTENAKNLTTSERQKIGSVLKALDEDGQIVVDVEKQLAVFDQGEKNAPQSSQNQEPQFRVQNVSRNKNLEDREMSFSSGHKFPAERSGEMNTQSPNFSRQNEDPKINRNVVDLRN